MIFWAWIGLYAIFMDFCPRRATKFEANVFIIIIAIYYWYYWIWTSSNICSQFVLFAAPRDYDDGCERRPNYNYNFATVIVIIIYELWQYMVWILDICWPCIKAIYNIGTEILYFQCLNCLQTRLFCKSIIPEEIKSSGQML